MWAVFVHDPSTNIPTEAPATYLRRQAEIAALATGPTGSPVHIDYTEEENQTWADAQARLEPIWHRYAALELLTARSNLDLPVDRIPQLAAVSQRLEILSGFRYASVAGTVPGHDFFAALGDRVFSSTQFIRWSGRPDYTPEPDVLHEVGGHAVALANPTLAELHRLAGMASVVAPSQLTAIASVFWYSVEFGVLDTASGLKAYGAGLLSSPGELSWFADNAEIREISIDAMISTPYDISLYQPNLFGAESIDHVFDVVGSYYRQLIATTRTSAAPQTS